LFLLCDLGINPANVTDIFMVPPHNSFMSESMLMGPAWLPSPSCRWESPGLPQRELWSTGGCQRPSCLGYVFLAAHPTLTQTVWRPTCQFVRVVQSARGVDHSFGNVFNGVIHFTIQLHNNITLPHFIDIEDKGGHLAECLFVFSDQHRRCCFCFHVGQFCCAVIKASGIFEALWNKIVLSAGDPAPPPVVFVVPQLSQPPAAAPAMLPVDATDAPVGFPLSPLWASLPCGQRFRSGSLSLVASEAAEEFSLISPGSRQQGPPACPAGCY
jgi:hypothetical protein